jgi:hypothetical protein
MDAQRSHWEHVFAENPDMYGIDPSDPGRFAVDLSNKLLPERSLSLARVEAETLWRFSLRVQPCNSGATVLQIRALGA